MKSERAKQILENSAKYVKKYRSIQGCRPIDEFVLLKNAERAAELAEQEAEERMRDEAIKVYCLGCACYENGECIAEPDKCDARNEFIKAINKI